MSNHSEAITALERNIAELEYFSKQDRALQARHLENAKQYAISFEFVDKQIARLRDTLAAIQALPPGEGEK